MAGPGSAPVVEGINLSLLRQGIAKSFNKSELSTLCLDLDIEYEDLSGDTLTDKSRELVLYCRRRGQLLALVEYCRQERPHIAWSQAISPQEATSGTVDRREHRHGVEEKSREVYLVHTSRPAKRSGRQGFDVLIYLTRHRADDLSGVEYAEFFLGRYWENKIFKSVNQDDFVGMRTWAWGSVLCTCRVVFQDGYEVMLDRYIDFEMAASVRLRK
jgi:hypothetical protein